ncbi:MAG: electron transfer flavoprotein subunit alpha/FixB family protein [Candidatus Bathyarchaeota archaeon]|jgi:electron transfer flavoprotein alpha subunit|nr:electron transfer flavoprotein subunit alpha/FixB family protein [Candidatus Bathyarchaeota archaeon]
MAEIFVLAEHRQGQIRDITYEMLTKAKETAEKANMELTAVIFGKEVKEKAKALAEYAKKVLVVEDAKLENFNSDAYQKVLTNLLREYKPTLTLIGHTSYGIELAPRLAAALNIPLATDCIDFALESDTLSVTRQMYGGKVNVNATMRKAESYMVTVRQAAFTAQKPATPSNGEIIEKPSPLTEEVTTKRFIQYILPPPGGVDITAAEKLVGIGRGIKDQSNIPLIEDFAKSIGAVLACSRPIVDKGWLPNDRQVGSSGKTVKPKLYIAVGISGAFQHVLGMKNSDLIIAINKDPNAPIFSFADYGVVEDLFKIVPSLKNKIYELKGLKA